MLKKTALFLMDGFPNSKYQIVQKRNHVIASQCRGHKKLMICNILMKALNDESCIEVSLSNWQIFHHKTDLYCGRQS